MVMNKDFLIKKWLNNALTEDEKETFSKSDDYLLNQAIIDNAEHFKASNFSKCDDFETFKQNYKPNKLPIKKLHIIRPLMRIASILVIAFGVYFLFLNNSTTTIETLAKEKLTIKLPDDSQVVLNASSQIEYNKSKWQEKRSVKLKGEAYFTVKKGKKFDVVTSDGIISVLGTQFNVKQHENYFEVKCFEGSVSVTSNKIEKILKPGDVYQIINGIFIQDKTTNAKPYWIDGISRFNGVSLYEVIEEFKRQYNVNVTLKNVNLNRTFIGGFVHNNIDEALISITKPMHLTYEIISSNEVVIHENKK